MRDCLNPPLIREITTQVRTYLQSVTPDTILIILGVLNSQCPHEGSARRPDMGILQHS